MDIYYYLLPLPMMQTYNQSLKCCTYHNYKYKNLIQDRNQSYHWMHPLMQDKFSQCAINLAHHIVGEVHAIY